MTTRNMRKEQRNVPYVLKKRKRSSVLASEPPDARCSHHACPRIAGRKLQLSRRDIPPCAVTDHHLGSTILPSGTWCVQFKYVSAMCRRKAHFQESFNSVAICSQQDSISCNCSGPRPRRWNVRRLKKTRPRRHLVQESIDSQRSRRKTVHAAKRRIRKYRDDGKRSAFFRMTFEVNYPPLHYHHPQNYFADSWSPIIRLQVVLGAQKRIVFW